MRITALAIIAIVLFSTIFSGTQGFAIGKERVVPAQTTESVIPEKLFDVDLLYAYVQPGASSAIAVLNFTSISNLTLPPDSGITEVYTVQVFSEGKLVRTTGVIGCIIGSGIRDGHVLMDLALGGSFEAYGSVGLKPLKVSYSPILNPVLVEPICLNVVRLGWITVDGNSTDINYSSNEIVKHVELAKYQKGFLYNTLLPEEELSSIDLFYPLKSSYLASPTPSPPLTEKPAPSASLTGEPVFSLEPIVVFSAVIIITLIVSVSVVSAGLVYYKKRKRQS